MQRLRGRLSALVVMVGSVGVVSAPAFASVSGGPPVVNGWVEISTPAQLEYVDQNPSTYLNQNIELLNNISLSGYANWVPLGQSSSSPFDGSFNGQGYAITGLVVKSNQTGWVGLFGAVSGTVENLGVSDQVTGTGSRSVIGGLAGALLYHGFISDSYATGSVDGSGYGSSNGGLVGYEFQSSIADSYATGSVAGSSSDNGGLVGQASDGSISGSYASGSVSGDGSRNGGLVGAFAEPSTNGNINSSYAIGSVSGSKSWNGGLVGWQDEGSISDTYAAGSVSGPDSVNGGFIGEWYAGSVTHSYFDLTTAGTVDGVGSGPETEVAVNGETTQAMQQETTYTGWDFTYRWGIQSSFNDGFPYLLVFYPNGLPQGQVPEVPWAGVLPVALVIGVAAVVRARAGRLSGART